MNSLNFYDYEIFIHEYYIYIVSIPPLKFITSSITIIVTYVCNTNIGDKYAYIYIHTTHKHIHIC